MAPQEHNRELWLAFWLVGGFYVALVLGLRLMGFADITDTYVQLTEAVPDLLDGRFEMYSRHMGFGRLAQGTDIRMGYPPGAILLHVPFGWLVRAKWLDLETGIALAALPAAAGEVLCAWALLRLWRRPGRAPLAALSGLGAIVFVRSAVVWQDAQGHGHWEGLMAFCALQAYWHLGTRPARAGLWAGAGLLLKTTTILAVAPLGLVLLLDALRRARWRPFLAFTAATIALITVPLIPYLIHDPGGVRETLVEFPSAIALFPGSVWWMVLRALGHAPGGTAFMALRFYTTPVLLGLLGTLSLIVLWRGPPERRNTQLLGLMAFGTVGLVALGKIPNPWYAVMGTALLLAWCGRLGTPRAWAWGIGYVLVQDTVLVMFPAELARGALTLWGLVGFVGIGGYLLFQTRLDDVRDTAPVAAPGETSTVVPAAPGLTA